MQGPERAASPQQLVREAQGLNEILQIVAGLVQGTMSILTYAFSLVEIDFVTRLQIMEVRETLHIVKEGIEPLDFLHLVALAVTCLNILCFWLDVCVLPDWWRDLFVVQTELPARYGRPRLFRQWVPMIRHMVEDLRYTNRQIRDILSEFGTGK